MNTPAQVKPEAVPQTCEELLPRHRCGTCAEWTRRADERMGEHGECTQRPVGHYSHSASECLVKTPSWSPKK